MEKTLKMLSEQLVTHHGDVVLERLAELPKDAKKCKLEPLALGEFSGHAHKVIVAEPTNLEFYKDNQGRMYFKVVEGLKIRHEIGGVWTGEHHALEIAPSPTMPYIGVRIQRVEDPYTETLEAVKD